MYRNAEPMPLDEFVVLRDRDALIYRVEEGNHQFFYDAFTRAEPQLHAGEQIDECPFCREPVAQGDVVVMCPDCGTAYHHGDQGSCWLAGDRCSVCGRSTALAESPWTPAGFTSGQPHDLHEREDD